MHKPKIELICYFTFLISVLGFAQNSPSEITATGNQNYCTGAALPIITNVSITDADAADTTLPEISVQIAEGYAQGNDVLTLTGAHPSITASWSITAGQLTLTGPATFAQFEDALLHVFFETSQTLFTANRAFSINLGSANFLPSTGHYYFYEPSFGISWPDARNAAAAQTYFGLQGYLATLTTVEESQLAGEQSLGAGWIGATDEATENIWQWVTGPEAGTAFYNQTTGNPINNGFSFWNTNEPNNFGGNENYAHITDPSVGLLGSWNDLPINGDPDVNGAFHPQGYIVEFGGMPGDPIINLSASTIITMPQTIITNQNACEGATLSLVIETNTDDVVWYDSETSTTVLNTGNTFNIIINTTTTYWISARFVGCTVEERLPLTVTVGNLPQAVNLSIQQCDDASADGISVFDLQANSFLVSAGITANRSVLFFEDANLTLPIAASTFVNTTNGQIIFAKVTNTTSGCFSVAEVVLNVASPSINTYLLENCDDEIEDGFTLFNLSALTAEILLGFPVTAQTRFYKTFEDAVLLQNQLPNNHTNTSISTELIYVRIQDGNDCLGISEVTLTVKPLPNIAADETLFYCLNNFPETLVLSSEVIDVTQNNYSYIWSTGEINSTIEVNEPGIYTVEVTDINGCSNLQTLTVLPSNTATIERIDVFDAAENNTLTLITNDQGNYEFALDNETGSYQDSNTFENVPSGIRTVFVRDKNGCGTVSRDVAVIGFPKYFTPNGDGTNDVWTIDAFNEEFLMNARVQIFNRYGKLLVQLSSQNPFWDGRYNGNILPTDDYWFTVTLQDGRHFTKHFSLKR